jgi:predicted nucleotidyltransferase
MLFLSCEWISSRGWFGTDGVREVKSAEFRPSLTGQ